MEPGEARPQSSMWKHTFLAVQERSKEAADSAFELVQETRRLSARGDGTKGVRAERGAAWSCPEQARSLHNRRLASEAVSCCF